MDEQQPTPPIKPPSPGDRITLTIEDIAFGGEGVGRLDDFVVFVPFVLIGEDIEAEVLEVKKRFGRAKLVRVLKPAAARITPPCPHFGRCGGCQYQHIDYADQLVIKHKQIADLFQRVGGFTGTVVAPVVPCPTPYGYRNRIMIRSQWNKPEQRLNIGFIRQDCGLVEDIEECLIAEPEVSARIRDVRANPPPKGGIKVVLRMSPNDWEVPPDSFFQNNFRLLPGLVDVVRERIIDAGTRHLVDAYCGVGFFGISAHDLVESFVGVEYDKKAVESARRNASRRGIENGEFLVGQTEELLGALMARFKASSTSVIIDPPRKGCQPQALKHLREAAPAQILYVSCNPATLARDLNALTADGVYELVRVVPLDMFPQTQHVECVADLRLRSASAGVVPAEGPTN